MAKDPAFLFYPSNASEDTQFMNRLERGAYFDLLKAQKMFGRFTIDQVKKVLGGDFQSCWPAIELVLTKDGEHYFIGWVQDAMTKRAEHSAKQKKRIDDYWAKKNAELNQTDSTEQPKQNNGISTDIPLENTIEIKNENTIDLKLKESLDEIYLDKVKPNWGHIDFNFEYKTFCEKVRGSPEHYANHDTGGMRLAFQSQLRNAKPIRKQNGSSITEDKMKKLDAL